MAAGPRSGKGAGPRKGKAQPAGPGFAGQREVRTRMVDNPLVPGTQTEASVNIRATALEWLAARQKIDSTQKAAGERFARLYRMAEIGGPQGIRYTERVQTSGADDPLTDQVLDASRKLEQSMRVLGAWAAPIVVQVLGLDLPLAEVAKRWGAAGGIVKGDGAAGYVAERLREALQQLAEHWGMAAAEGPPENTLPIRGGPADPATGPPREWGVSICGDVVDVAKRPSSETVDIPGMTSQSKPRAKKRARRRKR